MLYHQYRPRFPTSSKVSQPPQKVKSLLVVPEHRRRPTLFIKVRQQSLLHMPAHSRVRRPPEPPPSIPLPDRDVPLLSRARRTRGTPPGQREVVPLGAAAARGVGAGAAGWCPACSPRSAEKWHVAVGTGDGRRGFRWAAEAAMSGHMEQALLSHFDKECRTPAMFWDDK